MLRRASTVAAIGLSGWLLTHAHPHLAALSRLTEANWINQHGLDAAVATACSALAWLLALWLTLGFGLAALSAAPGRAGIAFAAAAARALPPGLHRIALLATGTGLVAAQSVGLLAPPAAHIQASYAAFRTGVTPSLPAPNWPADASGGPVQPAATPTPAVSAVPTLPTVPTVPALPVAPPEPGPSTAAPPSAPQPGAPAATGDRHPRVTVTPGDSLWSIAAHDLGKGVDPAAIATAWPRWYAANRAAIGDDPNLIRPGLVLSPPDDRTASGASR